MAKDSIPLTKLRGQSDTDVEILNHSFSQVSLSSDDGVPENNPNGNQSRPLEGRRINARSVRVNSTYISKTRMSRYKTTLATFLPFRGSDYSSTELPIDSAGCCSNMSFLWVRKFLLKPNDPVITSSMDTIESHRKYQIPRTTFQDSANVNSKRFLGIYKDEKQSRGRRNGSMLRVAWKFCRTRIIFASLFHTLSTLFGLCGSLIFLTLTLTSLQNESNLKANQTISHNQSDLLENNNLFKLFEFSLSFYGRFDCIFYMLGFAGCFMMSMFLKSITNWINLRSAIRLRTGIIAASYKKAMKCSIANKISSHQILSFANEESDAIMSLVNNGSKIVGLSLGFIISLVASIVLLSVPGIWPLLGVLGFFCLPILLSKISTIHFRKSIHFWAKKITVVEDFCVNFKDIFIHNFTYQYIKEFYYYSSNQFSAMMWARVFYVNYFGGMTSSVLLGGLYLIWCDADIVTNSDEILVLMIIYIHFIKNILLEYCESIESIFHGRSSLDKLKNSFALSFPETTKNRTIDIRVFISMNSAKFRISEEAKHINLSFTLECVKGDILGVRGEGKSALIYAIMGHYELLSGLVRQRGKIAFFPETPFIIMGSIKQNILMGCEFDAKKYYRAITAVNLNDDVLLTLGSDEFPIEALDLNKQQLQRVAFARALYCERDVYIFEQPCKNAVFSSYNLQTFSNIVEILVSNPDKAIIIVSSNNHVLNICTSVYDIDENQIYSRIEFERISTATYNELSRTYSFDNIKGCNADALTLDQSPTHIGNIHENNNLLPDESTEELISSKHNAPKIVEFTILNQIILTLFTVSNTLIYISLPVGFIVVVQHGYIEPWMNLMYLGCFVASFMVDLMQKVYMAKLLEMKAKRYHKIVFERLLNTSMDFLVKTNISQILNWFSTSFFSQLTPYVTITKAASIIFLSFIILIVTNYWITLAVLLILTVGQILTLNFIFAKRIRFSLQYFSMVEQESKKKMLKYLINNLRGRSVVYDRVSELCYEFYKVVEENSTALFLQESVKYYVSFIVNLVLGFNFAVIYILTLVVGDLTMYNYLLSILMYYLIMHYTNELVNGYLQSIINKSRIRSLDAEINIIPNNKQVSLLYEKINPGQSLGMSVTFKDVIVNLCGKKILDIRNLHIEKGDIIGFKGKGSNMILPLLFKLIRPKAGVLFLGSTELNLISNENLYSIISCIPYDLQIENLTISEFLNPNNTIPQKFILNKLQEHLPHILLNRLGDRVRTLSKKDKQLLCLIKSAVRKASIIVIEFPESEVQNVINKYILTHFRGKTIIMVGSNHIHFETCNKIVDFDQFNNHK